MADSITYIPNPLIGVQWEAAPETHAMIDGLGEKVAVAARAIAPVDTGTLRDSIAAHPGETERAESVIEADVPYAGFVEFGTSENPAQPYLRPALDQVVSSE